MACNINNNNQYGFRYLEHESNITICTNDSLITIKFTPTRTSNRYGARLIFPDLINVSSVYDEDYLEIQKLISEFNIRVTDIDGSTVAESSNLGGHMTSPIRFVWLSNVYFKKNTEYTIMLNMECNDNLPNRDIIIAIGIENKVYL